MVDCVPPRAMSLDLRLARLREHRQRWRHAEWTAKDEIPFTRLDGFPVRDSMVKVQGGTFAMYSCSTGDIQLVRHPSKIRGVTLLDWRLKIPGPQRLINLAFDPAQDVLLILEGCDPHDQESSLRLHVRRLKDGSTDPRLGHIALNNAHPRVIKASYMAIHNRYVAFFRPDEPRMCPNTRIMVWDWQTGHNVMDTTTPGGPGGKSVFLSDRYILVGEVKKNPHKAFLNVIDIHDDINRVLCKFQLPKLANFERSYISISSCDRGFPGNHGLFTEGPADKLVFVSILVKEILGLFVLTSGLVKLAEERPGKIVPWEDWGPNNTRFMNFDHENVNPFTGPKVDIIGMRAFMVEGNKLRLYDFNQRLIKRELGQYESTGIRKRIDWKSFEQEVQTCLAYRMISVRLDGKQMYATEDGIVGMSSDQHLQLYSI
ncbi:hypothetical protein AX15_001077 [Amanita polypyramis BW_CC]|nr:hypothetical protein AX15_001077 [Amanita polypyramis BW_CC]